MILPVCLHEIANFYHLPDEALIRITRKEHSSAIGLMGIQEGWIPILEKAGFPQDMVRNDVCTNIAAGAWILAGSKTNTAAHHEPPPSIRTPPLPEPSSPEQDNLKSCAVAAARRYRIHEQLFLAIVATEGGHVGQIVRNTNGSYDMGPAQINSIHLPELARLGITREQVINDGCLNLQVGAWILARALDGQSPSNPGEFWRRVGNYNSATPTHNVTYQAKVWSHLVANTASQRMRAQ